ncbi:DUF2247 family protein [Bacillus altitudinis]|uniref:DUF2247 family protein n=1 Tax=Bacillus altitudinis TaxID=293387 RepID=UPI002DBF7563|nr:DUF2247 family protein [Bacillus altitudinis]MEC3812695.1 DUF2247 family protein [Bacillus altitudinis]
MYFSLEHLKHHKIKVDWKTIYVGIRLDLISYKEISKYAVEYLSNHTECENSLILELAWGAGDPDEDYRKLQMILVELYNDLVEEESSQWDIEKRKWRYGITSHLKEKNKKSLEELLDELCEVYADFGYPEDMEPFIHYMPPSDGYNPLLYSKEENINRLVSFFDEFLQKEKAVVQFEQF